MLGSFGVFSDETLDGIPAESAATDAGKNWLFRLAASFS
jgi:hypothetical protein